MLKKELVLKLANDSLSHNRFIEINSSIFNRAKLFDILTMISFFVFSVSSYVYLELSQFIFFCLIPLVIYFVYNKDNDFKNPLVDTSYFEKFIIKQMDKKYGINLEGIDFKFTDFYSDPIKYIEKYFNNLDLDEIEFASIYYIEKLRLEPENEGIKYDLDIVLQKIKNRKKMFEENMKHYKKMNELGVNVEYVDTAIIKER